MAVNDKSAGPKIGQPVLYNLAGVIKPAVIYAVASPGAAVSLVYFDASGATSATGVNYDANLGTGKWAYPDFF